MPEEPNQVGGASDNVQRANPLASAVQKDNPAQSSAEGTEAKQPYPRWALIRDIVFAIGGFCAISLLVWQAAHWLQGQVDKTVTEKLSDEKVLRQIAAQVKPSIIFDAKESIISDMGAAQFVKTIRVTERSAKGRPQHIDIDFTRHFSNAPVLTALHDSVAIYSSRGKGLAWEFDIQWIVEESERDDAKRVYRLELIP